MRWISIATVLFLAACGNERTLPSDHGPRGLFELEWSEVAKDVWVGNRRDALRYPVVANTTVVIGKNGVLVFDGGGYAAQGEQVLAKVRSLTKLPVTHLVVSHWHGDHNRGTAPILKAFPNAAVITHVFTCAAMLDGPEIRVEAGEAQLKATYDAVAGAAEKGEWFDGSMLTVAEKTYFLQMVADFPEYEGQLARMSVAGPTLAVDGDTEIDLGDRNVELKYFGRGNTAGDLVLWLPKEHVVATGDIVVAPVPYGFGSYPKEWANSLREVMALGARVIVPGHGPIQRSDGYLETLAGLMDSVAAQADAEASTPDTLGAPPSFDLSEFDDKIAGGDPVKARLFDMFFKQPIVPAAMNVVRDRAEENEKLDGAPEDICTVDG